MNWEKQGQIYSAGSHNPDILSHASNPLAVHLNDDIYRVFFSARNIENKSSVSYVDIDIVTRTVVTESHDTAALHGDEQSFYSHGISIGNIYNGAGGEKYILYMGWQIHGNSHWIGEIGRLQLVNKQKLVITPKSAFMALDKEDNISLSYPYVIFHEGIYKMWYGSTITWHTENGEMLHVIKYATSTDGEQWEKHGVAIPYETGVAQAFSRPTVMIDDRGYHMWFSYRDGTGKKYRIGYAHSADGLSWLNKLNEVGIDVSNSGWDSEMICYPFVFDHNGERYMLYNGNDYGRHGFGLAKLKT
jgi:hypothetical protein